MAKLNEIIYDIRESIKEYTDDTEVDNRHLVYLINTKRAKYLRQDLNNLQKTTDLSIQQSYCLDLEEVSADQCGVDIYCEKILRSKKPLPKAIELHLRPAIIRINPTNRLTIPFNFVSKEKVPYLKFLSSNSIYVFLDTDYHLYVISNTDAHKLIDCLSVTSISENPQDLKNYKNCCGCSDAEANNICYDEDSEYPLQPHYIDLIKTEIINDFLRLRGVEEDRENDSND